MMSQSGGEHMTAGFIVAELARRDVKIGMTTVYRHLDHLTGEKLIRKFVIDGRSGSCYQFVQEPPEHEHFHLKCNDCGELVHLDCERVSDLVQHIFDDHTFRLDPTKTVLYGRCKRCLHS